MTKLTSVDVVQSRFQTQFYIEMRINGGALDEDLSKNLSGPGAGAYFPMGENGPTFLPNAIWYVEKLDFNNAVEYTNLESMVRPDGDNLVISLRFEGTFMEPMEIEDFPFDIQVGGRR